MTHLTRKFQARGRNEAQAFFAEMRAFPIGGASITFLVVANLAATLATLLNQG